MFVVRLSVCLSVRPSVCLSHSWSRPKRLKISKYTSRHTIERCLPRIWWLRQPTAMVEARTWIKMYIRKNQLHGNTCIWFTTMDKSFSRIFPQTEPPPSARPRNVSSAVIIFLSIRQAACLITGCTKQYYIAWQRLINCTAVSATASAFFVTVRAGTAYRKIWRLDNNFFCSHNNLIRLTVQKFQLFWVIFCIIIFSLNYGTF